MLSDFGHTQPSFGSACKRFLFPCTLLLSCEYDFVLWRSVKSIDSVFCYHTQQVVIIRVTNIDEISRIVTYSEIQYFSILVDLYAWLYLLLMIRCNYSLDRLLYSQARHLIASSSPAGERVENRRKGRKPMKRQHRDSRLSTQVFDERDSSTLIELPHTKSNSYNI